MGQMPVFKCEFGVRHNDRARRHADSPRGLTPISMPRVRVRSWDEIVGICAALVPPFSLAAFMVYQWVMVLIHGAGAKHFWGSMWGGPVALIIAVGCLVAPFSLVSERREAIRVNAFDPFAK